MQIHDVEVYSSDSTLKFISNTNTTSMGDSLLLTYSKVEPITEENLLSEFLLKHLSCDTRWARMTAAIQVSK